MNKMGNLIWGLVLVVVGVIFGLNALEITDINIFFKGWWTLFIIVPCFVGLFREQSKTGNIIGLLIGVCLLLSMYNVLDFDMLWKLLIPALLVIIGISFIFKDAINSKVRREVKKLNKVTDKEYAATFSEQVIDFDDEEFNGCELSAVFGSVKCDLSDAIIKNDVVVNASAIFGGISIAVPKDVNVKITSTPIFGGVDDKRKNRTKDSKVTIYINATCMFGGVDIK